MDDPQVNLTQDGSAVLLLEKGIVNVWASIIMLCDQYKDLSQSYSLKWTQSKSNFYYKWYKKYTFIKTLLS